MLNSYFTSVHSQHNESLICANIQYAYPYIHGRSATINTVVGIISVCPLLVGWLVRWGQIVFVSYRSPHGAVGRGLFMNIHAKEVGDMTWGGASGVLKWATIFWTIPKFPIPICVRWSSLPRKTQNSRKSI